MGVLVGQGSYGPPWTWHGTHFNNKDRHDVGFVTRTRNCSTYLSDRKWEVEPILKQWELGQLTLLIRMEPRNGDGITPWQKSQHLENIKHPGMVELLGERLGNSVKQNTSCMYSVIPPLGDSKMWQVSNEFNTFQLEHFRDITLALRIMKST